MSRGAVVRDETMFERGLTVRREVLGAEYVDASLASRALAVAQI
jgi:hypothetical protein